MWSNQTGWCEVASLHRLLAACGVGRSFLWGGAIVDRARCQVGSDPGGFVKFYESQCKSRDKYYLLFEERHSKVPTVQREGSRDLMTSRIYGPESKPRPPNGDLHMTSGTQKEAGTLGFPVWLIPRQIS